MHNIHFTKNLKKYLILSGAIFLIGIVMMIVFGPVLDIEFKGGSRLTYSFVGEIDNNQADSLVSEVVGKGVTVTENTDISGESKKLVISLADDEALSTELQEAVTDKLQEAFPDNQVEMVETVSVDPTIGGGFFLKSLYAMAIAAVLVIAYIAIRFRKIGGISAGVMALVALIHDILVAFFVCVIFRLPIDDNFVAVVLTILGYSLNDTIVIYDRVRENRRILGGKQEIGELVDTSINQVLGRTVMTSVATFLAMMAVLVVAEIMGLTSLRSLTIPMSIGIVSGAYSSVCLSGPLWVVWQRYKARRAAEKPAKPKKKSRRK